MKNIDNGTIVRTVVLFVALINQMVVAAGYSPLPFNDAQVEFAVSTFITAAAATVAWWKNNNVTRRARQQAAMLKREEDAQ
ncbi:phage holin [Domibacillus enclensis]|uniref:Holin, SPP1 family n=1 Tax=Domibacillus enclensis TaxID=1017273 RepID=A0A1N6WLH2_9BACI|nr:phage holin [Domibacillus enclensis]OXS77971.1 phage holin [Domibacillus enclensis]SIQ90846.1 holin, SPP1 family [Domibacillus enclensis]